MYEREGEKEPDGCTEEERKEVCVCVAKRET
jgi:hypothetical protein